MCVCACLPCQRPWSDEVLLATIWLGVGPLNGAPEGLDLTRTPKVCIVNSRSEVSATILPTLGGGV